MMKKLLTIKWRLTILVFFLVILFNSCNSGKTKLKIAASNSATSNYSTAQVLQKELSENTNIQLEILENQTSTKSNIHAVIEGKADLGIIQNTIYFDEVQIDDAILNQNIRTILPLFNQVLFIIYDEKYHHDNLKELIKGKRVGLGLEEGGDAWIVKKIFHYLGIDEQDYIPVYTDYDKNIVNEDIDISCSVTSYNSERIRKMMTNENLKIFSFDKTAIPDLEGNAIRGMAMKNSTLKEFIIPKYMFGNYPSEPILTVSTQVVMIANKSLDEEIAYQIASDIINHKALIINSNPIYSEVNEHFNPYQMRFPLHSGVKMYLNRDKPTFLVKYAEVIALLITIGALLFGGISSLRNWQKMKKKDRIDVFYKKIIDLDEKILDASSNEELFKIEDNLFKIRDEAFSLLMDEKLIADESFNIFLRVMEVSIRRIHLKIRK